MSDSLIIALLAAGCFVLWLFLHRRKPAIQRPVAATSDNGWFTPSEEEDPPPLDTSRLREALGIDKPSPTESVNGERNYTFIATAVMSPAWHNENGWPAVAVEYFPIVGSIKEDSIRLTAIVRALYEGPDLPDKEISETVPNPPEVLLRSLHASGHDRIKATFEIGAGIAERARKDIPVGYSQSPKSIGVDIRMELTGRSA